MKEKEELLKMNATKRNGYFSIQKNLKRQEYIKALDSEKHAMIYTFIFSIGGVVGFFNPDNIIVSIFLLLGGGASFLLSCSLGNKARSINDEIDYIYKFEREVNNEANALEKVKDNIENISEEYKNIDKKILEVNRQKELLLLYRNNIDKFNNMYNTDELYDFLRNNNYNDDEILYLISQIDENMVNEKKYTKKLDNK